MLAWGRPLSLCCLFGWWSGVEEGGGGSEKRRERWVLTPDARQPSAAARTNEESKTDAIRSLLCSLPRVSFSRRDFSREREDTNHQPTFALGVLLPSRAARMAARLVRLVLLAVARDAAHRSFFALFFSFSIACFVFLSLTWCEVTGVTCISVRT